MASIFYHDYLMMMVCAGKWAMRDTKTGRTLRYDEFLAKDWSEVVKWRIGDGTFEPLDIQSRPVGPIYRRANIKKESAA